jgi:glycosyltransferase involved in cell wall biosynthesis
MISMLRILSVCRTLPQPGAPGAGIFVFNRLQAMARQSDLHVLQPVPTFPLLKPVPDWARQPRRVVDGLTIAHAPMFYLPRYGKSLDGFWLHRTVMRRLKDLHAENRVDLVDAHFGYPDGVGCVRAARTLGIPVFVTIRGLEAERVRLRSVGSQLVSALNAATGCISVSHALRQTMIDHGVNGANIEVIPNAVDRVMFQPAPRSAARARLGLSPGRRLIVSVGHLIRGKRHDVLIRALARLVRSHPGLDLAIVGGADYEADTPARLKSLVEELGLGERVRFLGAVPPGTVANWLQAADVFALATAREGCCNAILEALATGVPVVTTPVGDNPYYVKEGINGLLAPVGDTEALSEALHRCLELPWHADAISRSLAVGTWNQVASSVLTAFQGRLGARRALS